MSHNKDKRESVASKLESSQATAGVSKLIAHCADNAWQLGTNQVLPIETVSAPSESIRASINLVCFFVRS